MARLTETGAFSGAHARPSRRSAAFPGVVGPDKGNVPPAKLIETVLIISAVVTNNFRTPILTITSNSAFDVPAVFQILSRQTSTIFWRKLRAERDLGGRGPRGTELIRSLPDQVNDCD